MSKINGTLEQRGNRYGSFKDNAMLAQSLMDVVEEQAKSKLTPVHKEMLHMTFHKISRMCMGDPMYADNPHDIAGYATLLENWINEVNEDEQ